MSPASEENQNPLFLQRMGGKGDKGERREGMGGGRKGWQKREERGVEKKMRGEKKKEKRKRWNEKGSQGRGERKKGERKTKF